MAEFVMPTLGADMEAGTLATWCKQPGEMITRGEVIAEIDTDKGLIEVECFTNGVIEKLLIKPGQKVPVGTVMALIREEGAPEKPVEARPLLVPAAPAIAPVIPPVKVADTMRLRISPAAKKMAEELGLDPATITGTGPGGRITREDIERVVAERKTSTAPPEAPADKHARLRQAIAAAMAKAKREIPHYYLSTTIDMQRAMVWLTEENQRRSVLDRLLSGVLLVKAVALALRDYPEFNAVWENEQVKLKEEIHIGLAISLRQGGLVAPALHHADRQSRDELMKNMQDLVKRTRAGGLRSSELSDATITITSLGEPGVETVFGIIYPPQVALVGLGKIVERPWVVAGQIVARPVMTATLSADHRASDGHRGALFLAALDRWLQTPEKL